MRPELGLFWRGRAVGPGELTSRSLDKQKIPQRRMQSGKGNLQIDTAEGPVAEVLPVT